MNRPVPQIVFEMTHLKTAEEALRQLHDSREYQEYRSDLYQVQSLEHRYALANRYKDILHTKFELEYAIRESRTAIGTLSGARR